MADHVDADAGWVQDARRSYDRVAGDYQRHPEGALDRLPVDLALLALFADIVGRGGTVVENGCGTDEVTRRLRDLGLRVVATDLSPGMLRVARVRDARAGPVVHRCGCTCTGAPRPLSGNGCATTVSR